VRQRDHEEALHGACPSGGDRPRHGGCIAARFAQAAACGGVIMDAAAIPNRLDGPGRTSMGRGWIVHRLHQPARGAGTAYRSLVLRTPCQGKDRRAVGSPRTGELGPTHHRGLPSAGIDDDGNATTRSSGFLERPEPFSGCACPGNLHMMSQVHAPSMHGHRRWHDRPADPRHARC